MPKLHRLLSFLIAIPLAKTATASDEAERTADRLMSVMEIVLDRHIEPPSRQEMVLAVARELRRGDTEAPERRLSREVSQLADRESLRNFLVETLRTHSGAKAAREHGLAMTAMLRPVAAGSGLRHWVLSEENYKVDRQLADNRYVGIGIRLSSTAGYPLAVQVFEDGPAARAGMRNNDMMIAIDGKDMKGTSAQEVIQLLRGHEGKEVTIDVRQLLPNETPARTLTFKRGVAALKTVHYGNAENKARDRILQVKIDSITGSTLHELRKAETSEVGAKARGVVLDLRALNKADRHHTVTLANGLLAGGTIGELVGVDGVRRFEADRECLFRGLPMAVLVDSQTSGLGEWLAAALQDNERATLVGGHTAGQNFISEPVPLPDGGALMLATHRWRRSIHAESPNWLEQIPGPFGPPPSQYRRVKPDVVTEVDWRHRLRLAEILPSDSATRLRSPGGRDSLKTAIEILQGQIVAAGPRDGGN